MSRAILHLLGTGASVSDSHRTTTMLALAAKESTVVVDCGGDVLQRALSSGIDPDTITALIITHEHPDHVSGFPLFVQKLWLRGRRAPLPVCGIEEAVGQAKRAFETFATSKWPDLPPLDWRIIAHREGVLVFEDDTWLITGAPAAHSVPSLALRATHRASGVVLAYSGDTEPSLPVRRLAKDADILVHEATGKGPGHSSAVDAAGVARDADARRLLLVHLPPELQLDRAALERAREVFAATERGKECGIYPLG